MQKLDVTRSNGDTTSITLQQSVRKHTIRHVKCKLIQNYDVLGRKKLAATCIASRGFAADCIEHAPMPINAIVQPKLTRRHLNMC